MTSTDQPVTLPGTVYTVHMAGADQPVTVRVTNRELVAWDMTRGGRKWPPATEAPFLAQSFTVFAAMKRAELFAGNFDQFTEACENIDTAEAVEAGPTTPGHEPN